MALKVDKLEEIHAELCGLLAERQGEIARTAPSGTASASDEMEAVTADIARWEGDAAKIGSAEGADNQSAIAGLVERAKEIRWRLCSDC